MEAATERLFNVIPGTTTPSTDGKRYYQEGFEVVAGGLEAGGWTEVNANDVPNEKNRTFTHTPYMYSGGERGGPLATYLVRAADRDNFDMWLGTSVKRVVREEGHVTGLEVEARLEGGYEGTVPLTEEGRVVLSAGTFGSAKVLLRSECCLLVDIDGAEMLTGSRWYWSPGPARDRQELGGRRDDDL